MVAVLAIVLLSGASVGGLTVVFQSVAVGRGYARSYRRHVKRVSFRITIVKL